MGTRNKKQRKMDLLEMSDDERAKVMEKVRPSLRRCVYEAKLWKTLLQYDTVTINGKVVFLDSDTLEGFSVQDISKV